MIIRRISVFTGIEREMDLDVTEQQIQDWESGTLIQNAMPNLTPDQREFIITGVTEEEWEEALRDG